jgi:hypothetical protein
LWWDGIQNRPGRLQLPGRKGIETVVSDSKSRYELNELIEKLDKDVRVIAATGPIHT